MTAAPTTPPQAGQPLVVDEISMTDVVRSIATLDSVTESQGQQIYQVTESVASLDRTVRAGFEETQKAIVATREESARRSAVSWPLVVSFLVLGIAAGGGLATLVGLYVTSKTAPLDQRVESLEGTSPGITTNAQSIGVVEERFAKTELELEALSKIQNLQSAHADRLLSMVWAKSFPEGPALPPLTYWPEVGGRQENRITGHK